MSGVGTLEIAWSTLRTGAPTRRSCEAASRFGLLIDEYTGGAPRKAVRLDTRAGGVTLFAGPSGAGKSTLLREAASALSERGVRVVRLDDVRLRERPSVDLLGDSVDGALRALARVGLGQADCFLRRPSELSDGQRWRLRLAVALESLVNSDGPSALIIDECCALLDPGSALAACATLRRAVERAPDLRVMCASADPRLIEALRPDALVRVEPTGVCVEHRKVRGKDETPSVVVEEGSMRDYALLASTHYRKARPARPARVLVARLREPERGGQDCSIVGALVVSFPTLNSAVRECAWPGRYSTRDRSANAWRLNNEVRTLSRAVVDPRFRGLGVAVELVRAYLGEPLTERTEGIGVMPGVSNFLEAAGMTRHELPIRPSDARLLDALEHVGVEEWRLAQGRLALTRAIEGSSAAFIERELRMWASAGRAHRRHADDPLEALFLRACRIAACRPVGYTHER
jgi:ABC-type dipeptide/oligopeptide/nickel transport system ATPase subunit